MAVILLWGHSSLQDMSKNKGRWPLLIFGVYCCILEERNNIRSSNNENSSNSIGVLAINIASVIYKSVSTVARTHTYTNTHTQTNTKTHTHTHTHSHTQRHTYSTRECLVSATAQAVEMAEVRCK